MKVTVFYDLRRSYRLEALIVRRHRPPGAAERRRVGAVTKRSSLQLATPAPRAVCVLCQLLHVSKESRRLASEKSHGGEECQSPRGGIFRVRWSNDGNDGKVPIQKRTRLWHDQGPCRTARFPPQIGEPHPNACHRVDAIKGGALPATSDQVWKCIVSVGPMLI